VLGITVNLNGEELWLGTTIPNNKQLICTRQKNPTPENSMEIVKAIAEEMGQSPNGVRMILTKAGVYVKKAPACRRNSESEFVNRRYSHQ
jgi:hypothetical protein